LAVTPSTGLKSGDSVTLSWSVTNTGTVATPRSFSDSVVVKNLRTNQILLNSQVLYDPNVAEMALFQPGTSRARQYTFNLAQGMDGVGDIQFTVTADGANNIFEVNAAVTPETKQ